MRIAPPPFAARRMGHPARCHWRLVRPCSAPSATGGLSTSAPFPTAALDAAAGARFPSRTHVGGNPFPQPARTRAPHAADANRAPTRSQRWSQAVTTLARRIENPFCDSLWRKSSPPSSQKESPTHRWCEIKIAQQRRVLIGTSRGRKAPAGATESSHGREPVVSRTQNGAEPRRGD
jgi:hypothetical protein